MNRPGNEEREQWKAHDELAWTEVWLVTQATREQAFHEQRLDLHRQDLEGICEPFMIAEGEHPMRVFIGISPESTSPAPVAPPQASCVMLGNILSQLANEAP
ncbi:MAG: hypothetical protein IBX53_08710 [Halomonas sp.]|uniref:hypothetical protein n=1 Tax=Halomonas sp. TaxID=1486246 RepID=UPI001A0870F4|nr:hypothetical protein [Halomonas sp.]MBE0489151.1 hypothetical protein [Halomonas sp.]